MAATKSNVNVKIESDVKELATFLLAKMGIDQTTAIDMFYRQIIAEKRLPFQPALSPTLDEQILEAALNSKPKTIRLDTDNDGKVIIDEEMHPELYDWVVNDKKSSGKESL